MKGDFSRSTFRKKKHYRKVKMQQGRVQVDADWNEQIDIQDNYDRTCLQDIIGKSGYPQENPELKEPGSSFEITASDPQEVDYTIHKGRYYVKGLLIENEEDVKASKQPDLGRFNKDGKSEAIPTTTGFYIAYLDVWERHLTALDDPDIQESALGGADTATRSKIIWQVKLYGPISKSTVPTPTDCSSFDNLWDSFVKSKSSTGTLQARSSKKRTTNNDPCILSPNAGYRRLDNQLYRVEIHDGGEIKDSSEENGNKQVTFKWSRDNGIVAAKLTGIFSNEKKLIVSGSRRDKLLGFASGQWVEIIDDRNELLGTPGRLVKLTGVNENVLIYAQNTREVPLTREDFPKEFNPKVRRWDTTDTNSETGSINVQIITADNNDGYIQLEGGVEVKFGTGTFQTGDYWLIPARTAKADVEWPQTENENENENEKTPALLPPEGIVHHFSRLAVLYYDTEVDTSSRLTVEYGCRKPIPSIPTLRTDFITRFNIKSGTISSTDTTIKNGTFKIIGPYSHNISNVIGAPPPVIVLGETNAAAATNSEEERRKINYMEDIVLLSMLKRQYGNHLLEDKPEPDTLTSLEKHPALEKFLKTDGSTVPVFFKAVSIDKTHFHILLINANKMQPVGDWDNNNWSSKLEWTGQDWNKIVVGSNENRVSDLNSISEVFAIRNDKKLHLIRRKPTLPDQNDPHGNWIDPPKEIGGGNIDQVVVGSNENGSFVAFAIKSTDSTVVYNYQFLTEDPNDYRPVGTSDPLPSGSSTKKAKQIVVGSNKDGRLEVFAIDNTDSKVYHIVQKAINRSTEWDSTWSPLQDDNTNSAVKSIAVGTNKDGRLEVFAIDDTGNILRHIWQNVPDGIGGGWSRWHTLSDGMTLVQIAVGTNKDGRLEVFAIDKDNKVYHIWQNEPNTDNWNSGWVPLGTQKKAKQIVVGSNKDGRLEVFAIDNTDNKVYHIWQNEPNTDNWNSGWVPLGTTEMIAKNNPESQPIAVGTNKIDGLLEVFAIKANNNKLYYISQSTPPDPGNQTLNLRWWAIPAVDVPQV